MQIEVDGRTVEVHDDTVSLLDVLRREAGVRSVKDGCSPQGQCGCCTVLVDGQPRVSCVTPVRRVRGRTITTVDGLPDDVAEAWGAAFASTGGSQCGFCTPGIICRFEGLRAKGATPDDRDAAAEALLAHLCRCTGWQPVVDAWVAFGSSTTGAVPGEAGAARAELEGGTPQSVGPAVALGRGGFADDTAPADALVAVPDGDGWAVAATRAEALRAAGKVQGRRTTAEFAPPLAVPDGDWARTLQTTWVEPAPLETDASWCEPGGTPASPLANGGAFGAKVDSEVSEVARRLADEHGRAVRVLYSREDAVRRGPKRPPIAAGIRADGTGVVRVVRTPGVADAITAVAPGLVVEEVDVSGPPTSLSIRGAGWVEAAVLLDALRDAPGWITAPGGGSARAAVDTDGAVTVEVRAGDPLDETVLRSYCLGAAHMGLSWVRGESLGVDDEGEVHDLTIRSFGILRAVDMPSVRVTVDDASGPPVAVADAVFAAVTAAAWRAASFPPRFPTPVG
jgi:aerobic-type carbon monoxide dehydrogenase small subunit (CoxS/CutS family)